MSKGWRGESISRKTERDFKNVRTYRDVIDAGGLSPENVEAEELQNIRRTLTRLRSSRRGSVDRSKQDSEIRRMEGIIRESIFQDGSERGELLQRELPT